MEQPAERAENRLEPEGRKVEELTLEERLRIRLAGAGLWKDHAVKGDDYLERLRSEWDRPIDLPNDGDLI